MNVIEYWVYKHYHVTKQEGELLMKKQTKESKHDKFVRLAEARTNKIIATLQLLGNCSNISVYEYTQDEVEEIFQAIEQELQEAKKKFTKVENEKSTRFSLSKRKG